MTRTFLSLALAICATNAFATSDPEPDPYCTVRLELKCKTAPDTAYYTMDCPEEPPSQAGFKFFCAAAPPPAQVRCQSGNGVVECTAWPQSPVLTMRYIYSVINGVEPNYSASEFSPSLLGNCTGNSGRVSVTVIAPNGVASTAQTPFACLHDE